MRPKFTPTQQRIVDLLNDGMPHTRQELHNCLEDRHSPISSINIHISALRKKLIPAGSTILCQLSSRRLYYRHVRLLNHVDPPAPASPVSKQRPADWDER